jgi:hypothetical protein
MKEGDERGEIVRMLSQNVFIWNEQIGVPLSLSFSSSLARSLPFSFPYPFGVLLVN